MENMTLYDFLKETGFKFEFKAPIAAIIIYGEADKIPHRTRSPFCFSSYCVATKKFILPDGFELPTNLLELMSNVNDMVKSEECPKNLKNRFYSYKKKIINAYYDDGKVTDIYDCGDCYSLVLDGKWRFHQRKCYHPSWEEKVVGKADYHRGETKVPFDMGKYNKFQIAAIAFFGERDKESRDNKQ